MKIQVIILSILCAGRLLGSDFGTPISLGELASEEVYEQSMSLPPKDFSEYASYIPNFGMEIDGCLLRDSDFLSEYSSLLKQGKYSFRDFKFSFDGKMLITGSSDGFVRIWNPVDGKLVNEIDNSSGAITDVSLSSDSKRVLVGSVGELAGRGKVKVWDIESNTCLREFNVGYSWVAVLSPDGKTAIFHDIDKKLSIRSIDDEEITFDYLNNGGLSCIEIAPNNDTYAAGFNTGVVYILSLKDLDFKLKIDAFAEESTVTSISFTKDSKKLLVACEDGRVGAWSVETGEFLWGLSDRGSLISLSSDGKKLILGSGILAGKLEVWNIEDFSFEKTIDLGDCPIVAASISNEEILAFSCKRGGFARVWKFEYRLSDSPEYRSLSSCEQLTKAYLVKYGSRLSAEDRALLTPGVDSSEEVVDKYAGAGAGCGAD